MELAIKGGNSRGIKKEKERKRIDEQASQGSTLTKNRRKNIKRNVFQENNKEDINLKTSIFNGQVKEEESVVKVEKSSDTTVGKQVRGMAEEKGFQGMRGHL